jgi:hypothetical protein
MAEASGVEPTSDRKTCHPPVLKITRSIRGPVVIPGLYNGKDKAFVFFSYEGLRLRTPQRVATFAVPDANLRKNAPVPLQPVLNSFPVPNRGLGITPRSDSGSAIWHA